MRQQTTQRINSIIFFVALLFYVAAFIFNESVKQGVINGVGVCIDSVIPSLFPMLIISTFITNVGIPKKIKKIIFFPIKKITGVHENAAESFILGAIAGYPVGVKTAFSLYMQKKIDIKDAQNAALINVNPGLAFSLIVTGKIFFGSSLLGLTLFFSVSAANLILGILLKQKKKKIASERYDAKNNTDISLCLINAVSSSVKSIVSICAWIVVFSAFTEPLNEMIKTPYIKIFFEVTSGASFCAENGFLSLCAFTMGFGGFCIFFQLLPEIKGLGISPAKFLLCRLFSGTAAFVVEKIIIDIVPIQITAFSSAEASVKLSSASISGSMALIFLCAVFMISIYNNSPVVKSKKNRKFKKIKNNS